MLFIVFAISFLECRVGWTIKMKAKHAICLQRYKKSHKPQGLWDFIMCTKDLLYQNFVFADNVNTLLQTVFGICCLNVLLDEHTIGGVNVNSVGS